MISNMYAFKITGFARIPLYLAGLTGTFTLLVGVNFNMVYIRDQRPELVSPMSSCTRCSYPTLGMTVTLTVVQNPVDLYLKIAAIG